MNLDTDQLGRLHAGETLELPVKRTYQAGKSYRAGQHRVVVLEVLNDLPVGFLIRIRLDRTREDEPRLLHRRSQNGYTSTPSMAMSMEPEAVDEDTQDRITKRSREAEQVRRAAELAERDIKTLARTLRQKGIESIRAGQDIAEFRAEIRRQLEAL